MKEKTSAKSSNESFEAEFLIHISRHAAERKSQDDLILAV